MALSTYGEIKAQLADELPHFVNNRYPEDYLIEFADGLVPVYTADVVAEWTALPSEYSNRFNDDGLAPETGFTIEKLMAIDLFIYYSELANQAFRDLTTEEEDN